jgi:hypothetical protein
VDLYSYWPDYFENFLNYCNNISKNYNRRIDTVIDDHLKPLGGELNKTHLGFHLSWDTEEAHTLFVLRWT